jgi:hypothetical protein
MGKFKNSADDRAALISIVRTMRSAGKGVTQDYARDHNAPRDCGDVDLSKQLGNPRFDRSTSSKESRRGMSIRGDFPGLPLYKRTDAGLGLSPESSPASMVEESIDEPEECRQ